MIYYLWILCIVAKICFIVDVDLCSIDILSFIENLSFVIFFYFSIIFCVVNCTVFCVILRSIFTNRICLIFLIYFLCIIYRLCLILFGHCLLRFILVFISYVRSRLLFVLFGLCRVDLCIVGLIIGDVLLWLGYGFIFWISRCILLRFFWVLRLGIINGLLIIHSWLCLIFSLIFCFISWLFFNILSGIGCILILGGIGGILVVSGRRSILLIRLIIHWGGLVISSSVIVLI